MIVFLFESDLKQRRYFDVGDAFEADSGEVYEIGDRINCGANGAVHRCINTSGDEFAVKIQLNLAQRRIERFRREQSTLQGIAHENLVEYRDSGRMEGKRPSGRIEELPFLVMGLGQGNLAGLLREKGIGGVPPEVYKAQMRGLASALARLHEVAIHRDIKPENILVVGERWVLSDYGLCMPVVKTDDDEITFDDEVIGPRYWMSPEGINRAVSLGGNSELCPASDVFQLASIFWYIVTGRHPTGIVSQDDWNGPAELLGPLLRALRHNVKARTPSAAEFAAEIDDAIISGTI